MGMAASQARLLTITARLNNIELQSQNISNAKIRLANATDQASDKYVKALNKTQYLFNTYNANGDIVSYDLSGAALTQYGELKNQYGLINSAGQILVSERDAANYQNSNTLEEFLDKYGVLADIGEGITMEYVNPVWIESNDQYLADLEEWQAQAPDRNNPKYIEQYWAPMTPEEYETAHQRWENEEPTQDDFTMDDPNYVPPPADPNDETWSLYDAFMNGTAGGCFTCSSNPASSEYNIVRHFNHVLGHLIGGNDDIWQGRWWWNTPEGGIDGTEGDGVIMRKITEAIRGKNACGENSCSDSHDHNFYDTDVNLDCGNEACDGNELLSDKITTLMEDIATYANGDNGKVGDDSDPVWIALKQRYYHIIEHDLKGVLADITIPKDPPEIPQVPDTEAYERALEEWKTREPQQPELKERVNEDAYQADVEAWEAQKPEEYTNIEKYLSKTVRVATDLDEAQWYVNLWNRMNGVSNFKGGFGNNGAYDPDAGWASKSTTEQSWAVLKDGDMNSPEYLKYAIDNGLITLEQVQFKEISSSEQGVRNAAWTSIVFTNAQDITEQKDEEAIARAEVEYTKTLKEIEVKDKQYDTDLKKLDTEHNALQTEYDSIKGVLTKNVERSFKVFNG